ncbi:MAG: lipoprotein [Campylobacterales bacterium]|nr:lipoprotein [Campylobacterales bacterium]
MKRFSPLLALGAALVLAGCGGGSSGGSSGSVAQLPEGKTLAFYNSQNGAQMVFDTTTSTSVSLDHNATNPIYMKDKEQGRLLYWPDEATGDAKIIMFKAAYAFDGNVTHEDFIYLGHFHGTEVAAHSASEFDPAVASTIKLSTLDRLSAYLQEQTQIKEEITEAMIAQGEELCTLLRARTRA